MKNENLTNLSEEIRKIKYRVNYKINETARYSPLVGANEEFDEMPKLTNEAGDQEDAPKPVGNQLPAPSNDQPVDGNPTPSPVPAFDQSDDNNGDNVDDGDDMSDGIDNVSTNPIGNSPEPENQVNDIQNDIIKHNLEAMKDIHDQLENLNNVVQGLNGKLEILNADVEEVREPTNSEKLMNKTNVSYPYYFNLNDFWQGNWFNANREKEKERGISELPDGTFVADFDELPQRSKIDVQNSFNEMN